MSHAEGKVAVSAVFHSLGAFKITVPLLSTNAAILIDSVSIIVTVIAPHIRFESPEVDLGLLGVGKLLLIYI